jgi:hypothetical protein
MRRSPWTFAHINTRSFRSKINNKQNSRLGTAELTWRVRRFCQGIVDTHKATMEVYGTNTFLRLKANRRSSLPLVMCRCYSCGVCNIIEVDETKATRLTGLLVHDNLYVLDSSVFVEQFYKRYIPCISEWIKSQMNDLWDLSRLFVSLNRKFPEWNLVLVHRHDHRCFVDACSLNLMDLVVVDEVIGSENYFQKENISSVLWSVKKKIHPIWNNGPNRLCASIAEWRNFPTQYANRELTSLNFLKRRVHPVYNSRACVAVVLSTRTSVSLNRFSVLFI